jgi:hypothetical protein
MIALDTNLLVYAHRSAMPEHRAARKAIERACRDPRGCGISLPCLSELWSIVTHAAAPRPSTPREVSAFIRALAAAGVLLWGPGVGFSERLVQMALDLGVRGARVFDLQIALVAFDNGAHEIWTHDAAFVRVPGLRVLDPIV